MTASVPESRIFRVILLTCAWASWIRVSTSAGIPRSLPSSSEESVKEQIPRSAITFEWEWYLEPNPDRRCESFPEPFDQMDLTGIAQRVARGVGTDPHVKADHGTEPYELHDRRRRR
jgi:hypothetical protein